VANSNTPNYKEKDVIFHDELEKSSSSFKTIERDINQGDFLLQTNEKHISSGNRDSNIEYTTNTNKVNDDGNSVDVTTQMVELMKVSQKQSLLINAVNTNSEINRAARGK
jgi:flagellar basal-body rod protein FlgB